MDRDFKDYEHVLRAVLPPTEAWRFWKGDRLTSAAFKKKDGLSVNRTGNRLIKDTAKFMLESRRLRGIIVSLGVPDCRHSDVTLKYCPTRSDDSHSEIWSTDDAPALTNKQALDLAQRAKKVDI